MAIPVDENHRSTLVDLFGAAGSGALRIALLFGSAAIALTIILTPIAEKQIARSADAATLTGIDQIATGSTRAAARVLPMKQTYVIRRSVLQNGNSDVCIIGSDGVKSGSC